MKVLKTSNYSAEPLLRSCGISISTNFVQVEGRVLSAPKVFLKFCHCMSLLYKIIVALHVEVTWQVLLM